MSLMFSLAYATTQTSTPLTELQKQQIGCIASLAILADEQARGVKGADTFTDVRITGRKWAGLTGDRIVFESGLPPQVIAMAINTAADYDRNLIKLAPDHQLAMGALEKRCVPMMTADLDAVSKRP